MALRRRPVPTTKDIEARKKEKEARVTTIQEENDVMKQGNVHRKISEKIEEDIIEAPIGISEYVLEDFIPSKSETKVRNGAQKGVFTIVKSKNCKRIAIATKVMKNLNNPKKVAISFSEHSIAVGEQLPNNYNLLNVKTDKNKGMIYSSGLVSEITNKYRLDFSNRTSITFSDVEYIQHNGFTIAIIKVK